MVENSFDLETVQFNDHFKSQISHNNSRNILKMKSVILCTVSFLDWSVTFIYLGNRISWVSGIHSDLQIPFNLIHKWFEFNVCMHYRYCESCITIISNHLVKTFETFFFIFRCGVNNWYVFHLSISI